MALDRSTALESVRKLAVESQNRHFEETFFTSPEAASKQVQYEDGVDILVQQLSENKKQLGNILLKRLNGRSPEILSQPEYEPHQRIKQLQAIIDGCESAYNTAPQIKPFQDPSPAILALQRTHTLIQESQTSLSRTATEVRAVTKHLREEMDSLADSKLLSEALVNRIVALREQRDLKSQKTDTEIGKELMQEIQRKRTTYEQATKKLTSDMIGFINERLSGMLAAEELGGPVVGGIVEVTDEVLEAGFSAQGRKKKIRRGAEKRNDGLRQRRIDEIWGPPVDEDDPDEHRSEQAIAAQELTDLLEELLNVSIASVEAGGSGSYVDLKRDSAAARFLVRAKVAQFYPRDARRMRLIDFGRELEEG